MKCVLRFLVQKKETCLIFDSKTAPEQWAALQPRLSKGFKGDGMFMNVCQFDWSIVRNAYTSQGLQRQRHFKEARHIKIAKLIEADEPTVESVLLAIAENERQLAAVPTYNNQRPTEYCDCRNIPSDPICVPA